MTLRRASLIVPCQNRDEFPTHLTGGRATEILAGWTALWHPALIDALGTVPGWRPSDDLPDPSEFDGELLVLPESSSLRMSADWRDRLRSTNPRNPPPVDVDDSRAETIAGVLCAAGIDGDRADPELVGDFLALGHAHLQVELLTRAMRYSTVLDTERFADATVTAARAAVTGNEHQAREELARAFDLLADARNHVYAVDFFVVDVTLLTPAMLGEPLRAKLSGRFPTSLLCPGEMLERMASEHPQTLAQLRHAIDGDTACVVGGTFRNEVSSYASPEQWLEEIELGQSAARRYLDRCYEVFALFGSHYSALIPDLLVGAGFKGALHASFDGGRMPRTEQSKVWWGSAAGRSIPALSTMPLDASRPETWLKLGKKISDTLVHDHVATVLLAGWPETNVEYYQDLQRAARYGPVLGKLVTLEEYFRVSREPDEWTRFQAREYPLGLGTEQGPNPISSQIEAYRHDISETHRRLSGGLAAALDLAVMASSSKTWEGEAPAEPNDGTREAQQELRPPTTSVETDSSQKQPEPILLNPWNFACTKLTGVDPADLGPLAEAAGSVGPCGGGDWPTSSCFADVPGWGFATAAAAAPTASVPLADDRTLRNERLEVTVSTSTGGIQSLRGYRDRGTRVSQRLAYHCGRVASSQDSQMVAERIEVSRNDALVGEIESTGRLLDASGEPLSSFRQRVRIVRGLPAVFVEVELQPQRLPEGDIWRSYFCSRLAWTDDAIAVRRGGNWMSYETGRERIDSPEWVEINDGVGTVTCFGFGLPYHRRASGRWLDTLLVVAREGGRRFQFALSLEESYPQRTALSLLTAGQAPVATLEHAPSSSRGWFLHVGARNIVATHIDRLPGERGGVRIRLLETEGRETHTALAGYRPFLAGRTTDFLGEATGLLSTVEGRVEFTIGAHQWIQLEAEW